MFDHRDRLHESSGRVPRRGALLLSASLIFGGCASQVVTEGGGAGGSQSSGQAESGSQGSTSGVSTGVSPDTSTSSLGAGGFAPCVLPTAQAIELTNNEDGLASLSSDGIDLYWTTNTAVRKMPKAGGTPTDFAVGQSYPGPIAVDDTYVVWVIRQMGSDDDAILVAPKTGGAPVVLANHLWTVEDLVLDQGYVYWITSLGAQILRVPETGGDPEVIASSVWGRKIAMDANDIYFADWDQYLICSVPKTGGPVTHLASDSFTDLRSVAVDDARVYWVGGASNAQGVWSAPKNGGPSTLVSEDYEGAWVLVADGGCLYWSTEANDNLIGASKMGGIGSTVAESFGAESMFVDSTGIYFGTSFGIFEVPK